MPAINYRNQAKSYLKNAKSELETGEDHRLRYAALDLRFAMEALTYDRAQSYKKELPPKEYETWQPRKLLQVLLEIDPTADKDSSISIGLEEEYGVPAPKMVSLGHETVLNLSVLKKHYDALGSILHVPTLSQAETSPPKPDKIRARCNTIADYVGKVLSSPVWNNTIGNFATITCNCNAKIWKRMPSGSKMVVAECFECPASYTVREVEGQLEATPEQGPAPCANPECHNTVSLYRREMQPNISWHCPECDAHNVLRLSVALVKKVPDPIGNQKEGPE